MYKHLLPIGSVVRLRGEQKRLMIVGRVQTRVGDNRIYDYSACYFPEGVLDRNVIFFFDRDAIERIYFIGSQDGEELTFKTNILNSLGELEVKDGTIVNKQ